ncbi:MAG: hypothetical protein PHS37_02595 [Candidatus Omnitrophica bacterium]|nr:hypothetical protein [Candidatus Omnitrophota bacterium]
MKRYPIVLLGMIFLGASFAFGATEDKPVPPSGEGWDVITGNYCTMYVRTDADLKVVEKKLKRRGFDITGNLTGSYSDDPKEKVSYRVDLIFRRVEEILNMYPRKINVTVVIYGSPSEMEDEYARIFGVRETKLISFYIYKTNTIYTNETDISDSVLAHEMGHTIADHYFVVRPPEKVREILSMYVDSHLEDD